MYTVAEKDKPPTLADFSQTMLHIFSYASQFLFSARITLFYTGEFLSYARGFLSYAADFSPTLADFSPTLADFSPTLADFSPIRWPNFSSPLGFILRSSESPSREEK